MNRGILASGLSGSWDVSIDDIDHGNGKWSYVLTISHSIFYFSIDLSSLDVIYDLNSFLSSESMGSFQFEESKKKRIGIVISENRMLFNLTFEGEFKNNKKTLRVYVKRDEIQSFREAVEELITDLDS